MQAIYRCRLISHFILKIIDLIIVIKKLMKARKNDNRICAIQV